MEEEGGNDHKLWKYIKRKVKFRTLIVQEKNWNCAAEGKVLRKYKKTWFRDPIINNIQDNYVHVLKRMRIGNSKLRSHYVVGKSKICANCELNVPETNEHFLLECKKYVNQRRKLIKGIEKEMKRLDMKIDTNSLLGFYNVIYGSKVKLKRHKKTIEKILKSVLVFLKETRRFE